MRNGNGVATLAIGRRYVQDEAAPNGVREALPTVVFSKVKGNAEASIIVNNMEGAGFEKGMARFFGGEAERYMDYADSLGKDGIKDKIRDAGKSLMDNVPGFTGFSAFDYGTGKGFRVGIQEKTQMLSLTYRSAAGQMIEGEQTIELMNDAHIAAFFRIAGNGVDAKGAGSLTTLISNLERHMINKVSISDRATGLSVLSYLSAGKRYILTSM